jgi:hypothetical protein
MSRADRFHDMAAAVWRRCAPAGLSEGAVLEVRRQKGARSSRSSVSAVETGFVGCGRPERRGPVRFFFPRAVQTFCVWTSTMTMR